MNISLDIGRIIQHDIDKALKCDEITLSVFADFSKAFDTINFNILTQKVSRTHFVQIDSSYSSISFSNFGVPQGSILDQVPFNLCVSDMEDRAYQTLSVCNMQMILLFIKTVESKT